MEDKIDICVKMGISAKVFKGLLTPMFFNIRTESITAIKPYDYDRMVLQYLQRTIMKID